MSKPSSLVRTIRLEDAAVSEIINKLDESVPDAARERRRSPRYPYNVKSCVIHLQPSGGGPPVSYLVSTRDISSTGIGFLHGAFVYPGAKCVIQLITLHGTWQNVPAMIARCDYVAKGVHDVGVQFHEPIDASEFCPEAAPCRVLLVDDNPAILAITKAQLAAMNADIDTTTNGETAIELASKHVYDVILMDMDMPIIDGFETVRRLRAAGYSGKIVAATGMTQPGDDQKCLDAGCSSYIPKPLGREQLGTLLRSLRLEPLLSSFVDDRSMIPHIEEFVQNLPTRIRKIETAFTEDDRAALQSACRNLKGDAGTFGFEPISIAAASVENALLENKSQSEIKAPFTKLITLCCQARGSSKLDPEPETCADEDEAQPPESVDEAAPNVAEATENG
ncbi:MAG: response regulator [Phycisphaerales bacterium]|nr:response regulator [Phycisphaerales bacterium]MCB9864876.1 response regulator [Phycisphaerales bacterium]